MTSNSKTTAPAKPTISFAGQRLLAAVDTPIELDGAALAARHIRNHVHQAVRTYSAAIPAEWAQEAVELYDCLLQAAEQGQSNLKVLPASSAAKSAYKDYTSPTKSNLTLAHATRIDAALGAIIIAEAAIARTVSPSVLSAYHTLQRAGVPRAGRHPDWSVLAHDFPLLLENIEAWEKVDTEPRLRAFMSALASALRSPPIAPGALVHSGEATDRSMTQHWSPINADHSSKPRPISSLRGQATDADREDETTKSPIGWLRTRADQAGYLSRWGVDGRWERQTKEELIAICAGVREALELDHPNRVFAFLATLSLATSLSARLASELKLNRNPAIWVDLPLGAVRWYLPRLLDAKHAATFSATSMNDQDVIDIWLPSAAAAVGFELVRERSQAADVLELITGSTKEEAREDFLKRYRAWLHSLGYKSLHGVDDARFGRSMSPIYREQSGDVIAALLTLDFEEVAIGTLNYVQVERSDLHAQCDLAWQRIGLGPACPLALPDLPVGSLRALTAENLGLSMTQLESEVETKVHAMMTATTTGALVEAWCQLVHLRLLATITLSAGRGQRLSRLTWGAVFGHARYMLLRDKDTDEYSWTRMVPIVRPLRIILDEHARDLQEFSRRAAYLGLQVTTPAGRSFDERTPRRICFYTAKIIDSPRGAYLSRTAISRPLLTTLCQRIFGQGINVGRHSLITLAVQHGLEPALIKVMTGHVRGQAEPFSDGQWIAPVDALQQLAAAMEWILRPICPQRESGAALGLLNLNELTNWLPIKKTPSTRRSGSKGRVLDEPFVTDTALGIRIIDHLRQLIVTGQGPSDADAQLLATLLVIQWVSVADSKLAWSLDSPFQRIGSACVALVMQREGCRAEIRRPLVGPAALAAHSIGLGRVRKAWSDTLKGIGAWLHDYLPALPWPSDSESLGQTLQTMASLWTRVHLPPYLLTAASSQISAPTATRTSLLRLMSSGKAAGFQDEVLIFPKPQPRGRGHVRVRPSPLKSAMAKVHEFGAPEHHNGENWERMTNLVSELLCIDTSHHLPAATFIEWVLAEAAKWTGSQGDRIKISSVSTYTSNITSAIESLRPDDNMREWDDEWSWFVAFLRATVKGETEDEKEAARTSRTIAAKRFLLTLASIGYRIPDELMDTQVIRGNDGMRKSSAATLLLQSDQQRVTALMADHFSEGALEHILAPLYCDLRWAFAFRSIEVGVLPLDAISEFDDLVVTTDGFAHLKSRHARRLANVPHSLIARFRAAALAVARARPGTQWLFLDKNHHDWSMLEEFEEAFSAALQQASGERDARPHAARAVRPLDDLFPGWELMLRRFLSGQASTEECRLFCIDLRRQGFGTLISVLIKIGHGHPVTFLHNYFAIWDLLLSVFAQATLAKLNTDPQMLARGQCSSVAAAIRQAKHRKLSKGQPFDAWAWATSYVPTNSRLPQLDEPPRHGTAPMRNRMKRNAASADSPLEQLALYLALRITSEDTISAAHGASIPKSAAAQLESILALEDPNELRKRHQFHDAKRARQAEVKYLREEEGLVLARSLAKASTETLNLLGQALTPMRAGSYLLPPIETLRGSLIRFAACLPPSLAILTQFKENKLQASDVARLTDERLRLFVGAPDRDLGERPRVFIVPTNTPFNLVARPRRTANVRILIAALQLIRDHLGTLDNIELA